MMANFWQRLTSILTVAVLATVLVGDFISIRKPSTSEAQIAQSTQSVNQTITTTAWSSAQLVNTDNTGLYVYTFPSQCKNGSNIPVFNAIPQGPNPQNSIILNVQAEGAATSTGVSFRITKNTVSLISLLGINLPVVSLGSSVGVTPLYISCIKQ